MVRNTDHPTVVGPTSPEDGCPHGYKDSTGVRLEMAVGPIDPSTPAMGELPSPDQPVIFPTNFPDESFYMLADASMPTGGMSTPGRARVVLALEAAFGGAGDVASHRQVVCGRVRLRIRGGVPGASYIFTHLYGQSDPLKADDNGRLDFTEDIGVAPLVFAGALRSEIEPFLQWTSGAAKASSEIDTSVGYVSDGTTPHTITESPLGCNFVRIEGPNIADAGGPRDPEDPGNINKILTPLFTLQS